MLGVPVEQCEFEVLESQSKGLFAKTNVRVRAWVGSSSNTETAAVEMTEVSESTEDVDLPVLDENAFSDVDVTENDISAATRLLQELLAAANLNVNVEVASVTGRYINLHLSGEDVDLLIKDRGVVLDSLQYLSNSLFGRVQDSRLRLTLDAGTYRSQRTSALEKLADEVANEVVKREQEAVLDPLPAHERRIIHQRLKERGDVDTYSEGEEPMRRIVISPKKD
jgi:spoIIIJ-associated protein